MISKRPYCGIIGAGRVGNSIARAMCRAGYQFIWVASQNKDDADLLADAIHAPVSGVTPPPGIETGIVIIAVPDHAIETGARMAVDAECISIDTIMFHLSGACGTDCLESARTEGASVMAFHPCQTFTVSTDPTTAFDGVWFDMEGDNAACACGEKIAGDIGARAIRLDTHQRGIGHLAMSMASNAMLALVHMAETIMTGAGIPVHTSSEMLAPLAQATAVNYNCMGAVDALTGPVSRGDIEVVRHHCALLESVPTDVRRTYCVLSKEVVKMAVNRGSISEDVAGEMMQLFTDE